MPTRASGSFDVRITPQTEPAFDGTRLGRMLLDKTFHGALDGTSRGQMLTVGTETKGSAVYVAVEQFEGTLDGRRGGFALHHAGIMTRGAAELSIRVVPDSGTGELAGLRGALAITIADGRHGYDFEYTLPA
jgi:hypothetical protein